MRSTGVLFYGGQAKLVPRSFGVSSVLEGVGFLDLCAAGYGGGEGGHGILRG